MRVIGRRWAPALIVIVGLGSVAGPAAAAPDRPDLDAFSGCLGAHSALSRIREGGALERAQRNLIVATIAASDTAGARKVAKKLRRARTAAAVDAAMAGLTTWCSAHGVPPAVVPTTRPPG